MIDVREDRPLAGADLGWDPIESQHAALRTRAERLEAQLERLAREAIDHCDRALALSPGHAEALAIKGSMLNALSRVRTAERQSLHARADLSLRQACELSPGNPRVWLMAGMFHLNQPVGQGGGPDGALRELRRDFTSWNSKDRAVARRAKAGGAILRVRA